MATPLEVAVKDWETFADLQSELGESMALLDEARSVIARSLVAAELTRRYVVDEGLPDLPGEAMSDYKQVALGFMLRTKEAANAPHPLVQPLPRIVFGDDFPRVYDPASEIPSSDIVKADAAITAAVTQAWCVEPNTHKEMDSDLAVAVIRNVNAVNASRDAAGTTRLMLEAKEQASAWERTARDYGENANWYREVLLDIALRIGRLGATYHDGLRRQDDGGQTEEVLISRISEVVQTLVDVTSDRG